MSDLIDREQAIDAVDIGNLHRGIVEALQNIISELPSAEKKGEWVKFSSMKHLFYCSVCGQLGERYWNYCPNCGARMVD